MDSAPPPGRAARARAFAAELRHAPATLVLLGLCVGVGIAVQLLGGDWEVPTLVRFGATERGQVWAGEWWRLLSAAFLHVGWVHLAWNVVFGASWAVPVERELGSARFCAVWLGSAVAASASSLLAADVVAAGASGALFGIIGAKLVLRGRALGSWRALARDAEARGTVLSIAVWSAFLLALPVDHAAHLGGLVGGAALAVPLTAPPATPRPVRRASWAAAAILIVPTALALVPRGGPTTYQRWRLEDRLVRALRAQDVPAAERALAEATAAGLASSRLDLDRAVLLQERGDLDGAAAAYAALAAEASDARVRADAARAGDLLQVQRLWNGVGVPRDRARARQLLQATCAAGHVESCRFLAQTPPGPAGATPDPQPAR